MALAPVDWPTSPPTAPSRRPPLRVLPGGLEEAAGQSRGHTQVPGRSPAARRPVPAMVRRRRLLVAVVVVCSVALALPLSGTGGRSHAAGPAPAGTSGRPVPYTVRPGDTLWSIASRVDPSADPRPLVAELTAATGSATVVPGERIVVP